MGDIAFSPRSTASGESTVENPLLYQVLQSAQKDRLQQIIGFKGSLEYNAQISTIKTILALKWLLPVLFFFFILGILKNYKCKIPIRSQVILFSLPLINGAAFHGIFLALIQGDFYQFFPPYHFLLLTMFKLNLVLWPISTLLFYEVWKEQGHFAFILYLMAAAALPFFEDLYPISYQLSESLYPISLIYLQARAEVQLRKER